MTLHKNNKQSINYYVKTFCQYYDIPNTKCHHNRENYNNMFVKKYAKRLLQRRTMLEFLIFHCNEILWSTHADCRINQILVSFWCWVIGCAQNMWLLCSYDDKISFGKFYWIIDVTTAIIFYAHYHICIQKYQRKTSLSPK